MSRRCLIGLAHGARERIIIYAFSFLFVPMLFLTAGCGSLKAPKKSDEFWVPPKWEKTTKKPDDVWLALRAKKIDSSKEFDLLELVNIALRNNPAILQAWYDARSAYAKLKQAESTWYPQVSVSGDWTGDKKVANQQSGSIKSSSYGGSADASMLAFDFGGRSGAIRQAYNDLIAANFTFNQIIQDSILQVESEYFALYSAKANRLAAEADVADAEKTLFAAEEKYKTGIGVQLDVLQARANYDETRYALEETKGSLESAKASLATSLGFPADTKLAITDPSWEVPEDMTRQDVMVLIEEGLRSRPDIASSKAILRSKEAAAAVAGSLLWPTLDVGGSIEKRWVQTFGDNKSYNHDYEYTGFLKASWDVFDGFNNYAGMKEARAERDAQRRQLEQDELAASADVWTKYYNLKTAISKLKYGESFFKNAESSFELTLDSYRAGLKSVLDILYANSQLAEARSNLVQSKNDMYTAFVELLHATGSISVENVPGYAGQLSSSQDQQKEDRKGGPK